MWFRRSIAAVAGSAILAGLIAAIVEQKKLSYKEFKCDLYNSFVSFEINKMK